MSIFFRKLADVDFENSTFDTVPAQLQQAWYDPAPTTAAQAPLLQWLGLYQQRLLLETQTATARKTAMDAVNPLYVLRNWLAQLAIDENTEQGSTDKLQELMDVLKQPYTEQAGKEHLAEKRPQWARQRAGCSMLSCSS